MEDEKRSRPFGLCKKKWEALMESDSFRNATQRKKDKIKILTDSLSDLLNRLKKGTSKKK